METNVQQYRCGSCGGTKYELYKSKKHDLIIECFECKSTSVISISQPKISIDFGEDSQGRIAIF